MSVPSENLKYIIPVMFLLPVFIVFLGSYISLAFLEMKIMKKLKIIAPEVWQDLLWFFGSRAHPFKFQKFIKENQTTDENVRLLINSYKRIKWVGFISWLIFMLIILGITILGIISK